MSDPAIPTASTPPVRTNPPLSMTTRVARVAVSWPLVAFGIGLLLNANLGVAPFDVLNTGVAEASGVSFGVVYPIVSLLFYGIGFALGGKVGVASVAGTIVIGPLVTLFQDVLPEPDSLLVRWAWVLAATLCLAVAVSLVITTELGPGPTEVFMLGLVNHRVHIVAARWITDGLPLIVGALLGGSVGLATVVFTLALGPLIKIGLARLHYVPPMQGVPAPVAEVPL